MKRRKVISVSLGIILLFGLVITALGLPNLGQAFGRTSIFNVRGVRVNTWVPNPPNGLDWTASPIGICDDFCLGILNPAINEKFLETGWIKGTEFGLGNQTRQYVTWQENGTIMGDFFVGSSLNNNTWYQFRVMHSNSANRWEAWRGNSIPWYRYNLGWNKGETITIGAEALNDGDWMNAIFLNPEYKVGSSSWTLFNYQYVDTTSYGCVVRAYAYGHHSYRCY